MIIERSRSAALPSPKHLIEDQLAFAVRAVGLPEPVREFLFAPPRKWRFDLCWVDQLLAVEIDGGTYSGGRHTRGAGFEADCEKQAEAVLRGWRLIRVTTRHVEDGTALQWIERALA